MIFNVQDKANEYATQLQAKIDAVKKANPASQGEKKKALIMVAYNDQTFGAYKSALQESLLNQLGYTNVATGHQAWPWKISCQWILNWLSM